jgi:adenine-specific DNA-methyltransferase
MTDNIKKPKDVTVTKAKGRPMLTWVGKKPLARVRAYPAQAIERLDAMAGQALPLQEAGWSDWPKDLPKGGLLYHGDNKDVLAHLLANGFRGKVKLIYIDPPFDSGADYVRSVQLRGAKGNIKIDGEDYTLGEQVQYSDIWANDNYLQFMYERLLLLRELMSDDATLYLHCDWRKHHHLRCLVDEVFGADNFVSEVIWKRTSAHSNTTQGNKSFGSINDVILVVSKSDQYTFNIQYTPYGDEYLKKYNLLDEDGRKYQLFDITGPGGAEKGNPYYELMGLKRHWRFSQKNAEELIKQGRIVQPKPGGMPRYKRYLDEMQGLPLQNIWEDISPVNSQALDRSGYPTQKPDSVLERIIKVSSNPGDLVLDCFVGSGTTAVVAQQLGRRWIGCDINKGAIQTTAKRIQELMASQAVEAGLPQQGDLIGTAEPPQRPSQVAFATYRVNDYDLQIQHNEAVELACQHLGVTRTRTDSFFEGTQGGRLVKIVPFNHPLTPMDLEAVRSELKTRPTEERDVMVVCLGWQHDARAWVETYNRNRPVNKLHVVELRTDRKLGGIIKHEPLTAQISAKRTGKGASALLVVEVQDVVSPTIMQRLNLEQGVFRAQITDWRAVVDCILIDTQYDGQVFNVALADVPERKQDLVNGRYELPAAPAGSTVAVKIIDMLGEELIVTAGC